MTRPANATADDYPQLEGLFCGYFHQDYREQRGDIAGALDALIAAL